MSPVTTLPVPVEIQKVFFQQFRLFMLAQEKTNSNCCTVALAVYLLLFSASYYLHSHSTTGGACIDMDMWLAAAACCDMG